jgi:hypothetical protein
MNVKKYKKPCPGCGELFLEDTTLRAYDECIESIPECWHTYSEILGREYKDPEYFKVHRITVCAYAAQHLGKQRDKQRERKARQSANLNLIGLYLVFGKKALHAEVLQFFKQAADLKYEWPAMTRLEWPTWITVGDVIKATTEQEHQELVTKWGQSVWNAYSEFHDEIAQIYQQFIKDYQNKIRKVDLREKNK